MSVGGHPPERPGSLDASVAGADRSGHAAAIEVHGISKAFGATQALAGVDLTAQAGRVLALLGQNGAGKTTLVRILKTLLRADDGWARVAGFDVQRDAAALRSVIGLSGQFAAVDSSPRQKSVRMEPYGSRDSMTNIDQGDRHEL